MLASLIFLAACGGREPDPVRVVRNEDAKRNCAYLVNEVEVIEMKVHKLLPNTDKTMENLIYGVGGFYAFFIPWILVDFKNAEAVEYRALRARHAHLVEIAKSKNCEFKPLDLPNLEDVKEDFRVNKDKKYNTLIEAGEDISSGSMRDRENFNQ